MSKLLYPLFLLCFCLFTGYAQTPIGGVINDYAAVVSLADADCFNGIEVDDPSIFTIGDRALLIQMNGATIQLTNDLNFGDIIDLNATGLFEIVEIDSIANNTVYFPDSLINDYDAGAVQQLVRIPQYTDAQITSELTAPAWNGSTGGIVILEATGSLFVQSNINVSGLGFRGAEGSVSGGGPCTSEYALPFNSPVGARKGEGIAILDPSQQGARGRAANAGGGGNMHNGGGGGGAGYANGGKGGLACNQCCGAASSDRGGIGGLGLQNQTNRLFLGGGGGQGHVNDNSDLKAGNGGGIIILRAGEIVMQGGRVMANGQDGESSGANDFPTDGHPGGGGGGTILLDATMISGLPVFEAWGGAGGNNNTIGSEGPGGGGGGGVVIDRQNSMPGLSAVITLGGNAGTSNGGLGRNHGAVDGRDGRRRTNFTIPESTTPFIHLEDLQLVVDNANPCNGDTIRFDVSTSPIHPDLQFSWSGPGLSGVNQADLDINDVSDLQSGVYTLEATLGCQTLQKSITINVMPEYNILIDTFICEGEQFALDNSFYISTGFYQVDLLTRDGCDSLVQLDLEVIPPFYDTTHIQICQGESYDGDAYFNDTLLVASLSTSIGCDSFDYTAIQVFPSYNLSRNIERCAGDSFLGITLNQDTTIIDNNQTAFGCDSITTFQITVHPVYDFDLSAEICQGEAYRGTVYLNDTVLVENLQTLLGCDSIVTTNLSVQTRYDIDQTVDLCAGETFQNTPYFSSTVLTDNYQTAVGCDSTVTTTINVFPVYDDILFPEICAGERFNGVSYFRDTVLIDNNQTAFGCDSVTTFNLRVHPVYDDTLLEDICQGSTYRGQIYFSDTILIENLQALAGCDSTVTTILTVHPEYNLTNTVELCAGESYQGLIYNSSTVITNNYQTQSGCDSTVTTTITVFPTYDETTSVEICAGEMFDGQIYYQDATLTDIFQTQAGCDSILRTDITVLPIPQPEIIGSNNGFCQTDTITLSLNESMPDVLWSTGDTTAQIQVSTGGTYEVIVTNSFGCTASATLDIPDFVTISANILSEDPACFGESSGSILVDNPQGGMAPYVYSLNGSPFGQTGIWTGLEAGQYEVIIQDAFGCEYSEGFLLTTPPPVSISLSNQSSFEIKLGDSLELEAQVNQPLTEVRWSPSAGISCDSCLAVRFSPLVTTDYQLMVTSLNGCTEVISIRITVDERPDIFAPNVFSPNGDGINDGFTIFGGKALANIERLTIMDRWGAVVFERENFPPNDESMGWTGIYQGEGMKPGVFIFHAELLLLDGRRTNVSGSVTLVR